MMADDDEDPLSRRASEGPVVWLLSDVLLWIEVVLLYSYSFFLLLVLLGLDRMALVAFIMLFARFGLSEWASAWLGFALCAAIPLAPTLLLILRYRLRRRRAAAILAGIVAVAIVCLAYLRTVI